MKTVCPPSWKNRSFKEGKPISYKAIWSDEQFARIGMGFRALEMEDKWFIFYEAPHIFFHRSWTGQPVYKLTVLHGSNGYEVTEALSSISFTTDVESDSVYQARLLDFLISNLLLGESKPFPLPPGVENQTHSGALQHAVSGTGYSEQPYNKQPDHPRKPWWRFW
jgi:hypothetical protein